MTRYLVGIGGTPDDQWSEYEDLTDAEEACLELARSHAIDQGIDPDDVELYESGPDIGGVIDRGACPYGDTGAYWPVICPATGRGEVV